jgi:DNA-binding NarL/FixJ family response regulator
MEAPACRPEHAAKRSQRRARGWQRRGHNLPEFRSLRDPAENVAARSRVSIALIDPKPLTRQSMLDMLANSLPEYVRLVGASSFDELNNIEESENFLEYEEKQRLVILYIRNAGVNDAWVQEQLQLIRHHRPEPPVIMISDREDSEDVATALGYGVRGYIPTSIAVEVAIAALTLIDAGGIYIPVCALRSEGPELLRGNSADDELTSRSDKLNLTTRELTVIDLLREGAPNKVIALELNMRESTVKVHVRNILKKLRVSNRTHAATLANRLLALPDTTNDRPGRPH